MKHMVYLLFLKMYYASSYYIKSIVKCNINSVLSLKYFTYNYENISLKICTTIENIK